MANNQMPIEIATGLTIKGRLYNLAGQVWNGSSFEAYNGSNLATYDLTATEQGSSGRYHVTFPAGITTAGTYLLRGVIGAAAAGPAIWSESHEWDGAALKGFSGSVYNGFIWIDTVNGSAGTTAYTHGTSDNPVSTIADANTLAAALGISRFKVASGSTITLAASQQAQLFEGDEWTLALGGQNIAGTTFRGAVVSGTGTGSNAHFDQCEIGTVTLADCEMNFCRFRATITLSAAGDYFFRDCEGSAPAGLVPTIDFGAAVGNTNLSMRRYSGGITIDNKEATGVDTLSIDGNGQLIVSASSGGDISVSGDFRVTNAGGATIFYDDNTANIVLILADTGTDGVKLTTAANNAIADAVLVRGASNIEDTADRHSLGAVIMIGTNASVSGTTLTAKKPSDDSTFNTYTVTTDDTADPITGVS